SLTEDVADLAGCGLVIEAAFEDLAVKRELFRELEAVVAPDAILATNTSALSVTEIASGLERPERVVGMHFFNPAPLLPLVEIVRAVREAPRAADGAAAPPRADGAGRQARPQVRRGLLPLRLTSDPAPTVVGHGDVPRLPAQPARRRALPRLARRPPRPGGVRPVRAGRTR